MQMTAKNWREQVMRNLTDLAKAELRLRENGWTDGEILFANAVQGGSMILAFIDTVKMAESQDGAPAVPDEVASLAASVMDFMHGLTEALDAQLDKLPVSEHSLETMAQTIGLTLAEAKAKMEEIYGERER